MKPLAGRPPTAPEVALAVIWPALLIALLIAIGMFDALLLAAIIWKRHDSAASLLAIALKVSAAFALLPGIIWLLCYTGEAIGARAPTRRAAWLRSAAGITRTISSLVRIGLVAALALMALLMFALPSGREAVAALAAALLATLALFILLRTMNRRMRILTARARRHARRLCPKCNYDITGLTRCPECGAPVGHRRL